jgi:hypothetical protein
MIGICLSNTTHDSDDFGQDRVGGNRKIPDETWVEYDKRRKEKEGNSDGSSQEVEPGTPGNDGNPGTPPGHKR